MYTCIFKFSKLCFFCSISYFKEEHLNCTQGFNKTVTIKTNAKLTIDTAKP